MSKPAFEFRPADSTFVVHSAQAKDWHRLSRLLWQLAEPDLPDWVDPEYGMCQAIASHVDYNDVITEALLGALRWFLFPRPTYPVLPPDGEDAGVTYNTTSNKWEGEYGENRRRVAAMMAGVAQGVYEFLSTTQGGMYFVLMPVRDPQASTHRLYFSLFQ